MDAQPLIDLAVESFAAAGIALAVAGIVFGALAKFRPLQELVLPGRDEAADAETAVRDALAAGKVDLAIALLFAGLAVRGAARILAVALIFGVTLWSFAPLA